MRVAVACIAIALVLVGCASPSRVVGSGANVTVAPDLPLHASIMQRVSAMICADSFIAPTPSSADALKALQDEAAAIGASGVYKVKYAQTGLLDRCGLLPGLEATAIAYRM
ncbi:hypothetical protein [Mesorhizobium sp. 1M-11]|uniref:hypothetical protein n=1 Tax=Mesorhizobium sp. 1M-11 TaxID=1529006 RepID=UPI0006C73873|nr:hypothetical protein [Mesorhizobium sp. 1M-11]